MSRGLITGIIQTENKPVIFSVKENEFEFTFMTDSIYSFSKRNIPTKVPSENEFIFGKTHGNHDIAIYTGNIELEVLGSRCLNTSAYIKSTSNLTETSLKGYEGISFHGGTLNTVFDMNAMDMEWEEGKIIVKCIDDSIRIVVETNKYNMEIDIYSVLREQMGISGNSISNSETVLMLKFDKEQPLNMLFEHYNRIKELLSFMTFRENVGFEKIFLLKNELDRPYLSSFAEVYIRNETEIENKDCIRNITFEDLGESQSSLIKLFYDAEDKKQSLSLGFIPSCERDRIHMNNTKIRAICSALECELSFIDDIKTEENKLLDELIRTVKKSIKDFRKEHDGLGNDTYNLISSNIKYWSLPLAEKLCALYHKYEEEIEILNISGIRITDEGIKEFVKYRNDITHGKHRIPNIQISITAYYMCGIIYCCILERIGIDRVLIKEWCKSKILQ